MQGRSDAVAATAAPEVDLDPARVAAASAESQAVVPSRADVSEEARSARGVMVPDGPSNREKDEHYLNHIPFRSWCSFCVRGCAADDRRS